MSKGSILYIPHGGGPLPLLGHAGHSNMVRFLNEITNEFIKPSAILILSAHWETESLSITSGAKPDLIYDYTGFPPESYRIQYPAPGNPELANRVFTLLNESGISSKLDEQRGFDHGMFVPLTLMYPQADIPCIQLSLKNNLNAAEHIEIGKALSVLRNDNVMILGSGYSFHNMQALMATNANDKDEQNEAFENWLIETCTSESLSSEVRKARLTDWQSAPHARYCHPREEHLLPLHVCFGAANYTPARLVFKDKILGKMTSSFLW